MTLPVLSGVSADNANVCRQRQWKKDKLQISYDILGDSLNHYQPTVKKSKADYYSDIINKQAHRPKVLFKTITLILNFAVHTIDSFPEACENFLIYLITKIDSVRANILIFSTLNQFHPLSRLR